MRSIGVAIAIALVAAMPAAASPVQEGKGLYGQYCVACHGANGEGVYPGRAIGGSAQRNQSRQPGYGPSLRGVGARAADFYLRTGYMPLHHSGLQPRRARVLFSEAQIRALVAYVASLKKGPPIPTPHPERGNLSEGLKLFTDHCAGCHQVVAQGGVVSGALPPPLEDATDVQVAEAVRIGPYIMPRFSTKVIDEHQLDSIVRYVDWTKHADNRGGWALGDVGPVPEGLVTWFIAAAALVALCVIIGERIKRE
jgi:ubiquinol-cytochrome c reductase cytochrome c subunit